MCGITAIVGFDFDDKDLDNANRSLYHRGPDTRGKYIDRKRNVALAHTRLSIIDLETGDQPLFSEDKKIILVCNGEIYNSPDLRTQLIKSGHTFKTGTDVGVILHLYEDFGVNCVKQLQGMFAFALWDKSKQALLHQS